MRERKVYVASRGRFVWLSIGSYIFMFFGLIAFKFAFWNEGQPELLFFSTLIVLTSMLCIFVFAFAAVLGLPRIVLSRRGIRHDALFRRKFWPWSEVGPFGFMRVEVRQRGVRQVIRAAGAFSAEHAYVMKTNGQSETPTYGVGDIELPLTGFAAGESDAAGKTFVRHLNHWRRRYGAPVQAVAAARRREITSRLKERSARAAFMLAMILPLSWLLFLLLDDGAAGMGDLLYRLLSPLKN